MSGSDKRFLSPEEVDHAVQAMLSVVAVKPDIQVAIAGGIALQIYGSPKPTTDVDFIGNWTLGQQHVFNIDKPLSLGGLRYILDPGIPVDLIVRKDAYRKLYEEALENAIDQGGVPVIAPDYLAATKFASGRQKDIDAVAWLIAQPGLVDVKHVSEIMSRTLGGTIARDAWENGVAKLTASLKHFKRKREE